MLAVRRALVRLARGRPKSCCVRQLWSIGGFVVDGCATRLHGAVVEHVEREEIARGRRRAA